MATITLCGSNKFRDQILLLAAQLMLKERHVLNLPQNCTDIVESYPDVLKPEIFTYIQSGLLLTHFEKIRKSDLVIICNFNGYCGNSTTLELGYAYGCGKPIAFIDEDEELARQVLSSYTIFGKEHIENRKDGFKYDTYEYDKMVSAILEIIHSMKR